MSVDPTVILTLLAVAAGGPAGGAAATASTGARMVGGAVTKQLAGTAATRAGAARTLGAVDDLAAMIPGRWRVPLRGDVDLVRRFEKPPQKWNAGHRGVDLRTNGSGAVLAANNGRVFFAGSVAGKPTVSILHPGGVKTTYEPVIASVSKGDSVLSGQVIGRLTSRGNHCSPRSCLHWGALRGGDYIDPLTLLGGTIRLLPLK